MPSPPPNTSVFIAIDDAVRITCSLALLEKQLHTHAHKNIATTTLCILRLHLQRWSSRENAREYSARILEGPRTRAVVAHVGIHVPMRAICSIFLLADAKAMYAREFAGVLRDSFCARELLRIRSYTIRYGLVRE